MRPASLPGRLREQGAYLPGSEYILMTLTDMEDPGLMVFPHPPAGGGLEGFDGAAPAFRLRGGPSPGPCKTCRGEPGCPGEALR